MLTVSLSFEKVSLTLTQGGICLRRGERERACLSLPLALYVRLCFLIVLTRKCSAGFTVYCSSDYFRRNWPICRRATGNSPFRPGVEICPDNRHQGNAISLYNIRRLRQIPSLWPQLPILRSFRYPQEANLGRKIWPHAPPPCS